MLATERRRTLVCALGCVGLSLTPALARSLPYYFAYHHNFRQLSPSLLIAINLPTQHAVRVDVVDFTHTWEVKLGQRDTFNNETVCDLIHSVKQTDHCYT